MSDLFIIDGEKMTVNLHKGQTRAWESERRDIFIVAGHQGGKTSFEPLWLDREIKNKGRGDYLAVTATYDLFKLKFLPEMLNYFQHLFKWEYSASERVIWRQDKPRLFTRIILRSAEAEGGLESATAKGAIFDECGQDSVKVTAYEAIKRRLSLNRGRLLGATTPYNLGWLKTEIYDRWQKGDPSIEVVQFSSIMNPNFPKEEYYERKAKMPAWKFEMFYNGNFSRPAGLIYDNFTDEYVVPRFAIPPDWKRYVGMDFGLVNLAALFYANEPNTDKFYLYRTYHSGGFSVPAHVQKILKNEPRLPLVVGGSKSEGNWRSEFRASGLPVREPDIKSVEVGIDRVYDAHAGGQIYAFDDLTEYLDQKHTYARELDDSGEPTEKIKDKETYHLIDAERYIIGYIKRKGTKMQTGNVDFYAKAEFKPLSITPARSDEEIEQLLAVAEKENQHA